MPEGGEVFTQTELLLMLRGLAAELEKFRRAFQRNVQAIDAGFGNLAQRDTNAEARIKALEDANEAGDVRGGGDGKDDDPELAEDVPDGASPTVDLKKGSD